MIKQKRPAIWKIPILIFLFLTLFTQKIYAACCFSVPRCSGTAPDAECGTTTKCACEWLDEPWPGTGQFCGFAEEAGCYVDIYGECHYVPDVDIYTCDDSCCGGGPEPSPSPSPTSCDCDISSNSI